jgi:hypothetical protein
MRCYRFKGLATIEIALTESAQMSNRERAKSALEWRVGMALVVVACAMLICAAFVAMKTKQFLAQANLTPGRVISLERSSSVRGSVYYPIVQFRAATGQSVVFRSSLANVAALGSPYRCSISRPAPETPA